ncbi:MAG: rod shape-determining protein MreC [Candidatus Acidiferrales bacterium]
MLDFPSRQRPFPLLVTVVLVQVLLLAFQIKRDNDVRLVRVWAVEILTPLQRAATWSISSVRGGWRNYIDLRRTHAENEFLKAQVDKLQLQNRQLESRAAEADRLAALLNFKQSHTEVPMLVAQVIGASADLASRTIFINRGEHDHLRRNLPVITPDGVVGKIVEVLPGSSQVLLISDQNSGVGALFAETRTHGVVKGTSDPLLRLEYIANEEKVHVGELVVTSGEDKIYPKDLPVGTVTTVKQGNPFQVITVEAAARLDRLEDVIVLMTQQEVSMKKPAEEAEAPQQ